MFLRINEARKLIVLYRIHKIKREKMVPARIEPNLLRLQGQHFTSRPPK